MTSRGKGALPVIKRGECAALLRLTVRRVRPEETERLRRWLSVLNTERADEARATLVDEGCAHEMGILVETSDGPLLVYAMEVQDVERSRRAAANSSHPIDAEHRAVMKAALGGHPPHEVLLDLRTAPEA